MTSADTNLFLCAANPASSYHPAAAHFFARHGDDPNFVVCELVLVDVYMQLRNPAVLRQPLASREAAGFCKTLRSHPRWQWIDYVPEVSKALWEWAESTDAGFRRIIDARLAFTLLLNGVTEFATENVKDFEEFGFQRVWNPLR